VGPLAANRKEEDKKKYNMGCKIPGTLENPGGCLSYFQLYVQENPKERISVIGQPAERFF
jgi:hypothetical protein